MRFFIGAFIYSTIILVGISQEYITVKDIRMIQHHSGTELDNNFVYALHQDRSGYLWIGTIKNLLKYDGQEFQPIAHGYVDNIHEDQEGNIWFNPSGQASYYNPRYDSLIHVDLSILESNFENNVHVSSFASSTDGQIYLGTNVGVFGLDKNSGSGYSIDTSQKVPHLPLKSMTSDHFDNIWIGGDSGLWKITQNFETIERVDFLQPENSTHPISKVKRGKKGNIWIIANPGGPSTLEPDQLYCIDPVSNKITHFRHDFDGWVVFYDILEFGESEFWLGTKEQGFYRVKYGELDTIQDHLIDISAAEKYDYIDGKDVNVGTPNFRCLLEDRSGGVWGGTHMHGLFHIPKKINQFAYYDLPSYEKYANNSISYLLEDENKNIWMTSFIHGAFYFDIDNREFKHYPHDINNPYSPASNSLMTIFEDSQGKIWITGSNSSINRYDPEIDGFHRYWIGPRSYAESEKFFWENTIVGSISEDNSGNFWIATDGAGIIRFDPRAGKVLNAITTNIAYEGAITGRGLLHESVISTYIDQNNELWVTSPFHGIYKADGDIESGDIYLDNFLPNIGMAVFMDLDHQGRTWMTNYGRGLMEFDPVKKEVIATYSVDQGFMHSEFSSFDIDNDGNLWLGHPLGVSKFNPDNHDILNFGKEYGIENSHRLSCPVMITEDQKVVVGGKQGLYLADLEDLKTTDQITPKVNVSSINAGGKKVSDIRNQSANYLGNIKLKHNQNDLTIKYNGIHFDSGKNISFQYRLLGWQDNWVNVGNESIARFSNLPPDDYRFQIKAANADGIWSPVKNLNITISPARWNSGLARSLYGILVLLVLYGLYHARLRNKIQRVEAAQLKALNTARTKLYTNITHEFRTPLTVIGGMAQRILEEPKGIFHSGLQSIIRNTGHLLQLVNQMLELQKVEADKMDIDWVQGDIINYVKYLVESFHSLAYEKGIEIHFSSAVDELMMDMDEQKLRHIIYNLMSNAIKFSSEKDEIWVGISQPESEYLEITIRDSGIGIPSEQLPHIFDLFHQVEDDNTRMAEGTGIGLALVKELVTLLDGSISVESQLQKGSTFTVRLPIRNNAHIRPVSYFKSTTPTNSPYQSTSLELDSPVQDRPDLPIAMIVEDNEDVASYIHLCLEGKCRAIHSSDGEMGLAKAKKVIPDIIISDVMMPKMDGLEMMKLLVADVRTDHIPVILLTAKADLPSKLEGLNLGADAYLTKPFEKEELIIRVDKLIEKQKRLQFKYRQGIRALTKKIENPFLQQLDQFLEQHSHNDDMTVEQIAKHMALSRVQLFRKIKALTGQSTSNYLRDYRLKRAYWLLQNSSSSISEIAYDVGFSSLAYFSRSFKELYGMSPSSLR